MPIFEYVCKKCRKEFELLVRGGEEPACPACGKKELAKQFSVPAAHTAGSTPSPCPAQETGSCGVANCGGGGCGMANFG